MRDRRLLQTVLWTLCLLLPGCQLPGLQGPVSRSLEACRGFSQQGIAAIERGQWVEAETLLAQAVRACPNDPEARHHYAETLWHRGARQEAIGQLEEAARIAGQDAAMHVRIAEMRLALGQVPLARSQAEQALDVDPKLSTAWAMRGRVNHAAGQLREALADYYRALTYAPNDREMLLEIAELHVQWKRPQRALSVLHRLVNTYSPGEEPQDVLYLQGLAQLELQRYDDAVDSFSLAGTRNRPTPEILYRLAEAEFSAGRPAEAAAAARQALALDPQHRQSRDLLARLEPATAPPRPLQR